MATAQPGIFAPDQPHRAFLTFRLAMPPENEALADALAEIREIDDVDMVIAFGPKALTLLNIDAPDNFHGFSTLSSPDGRFHAESTQADLFIWLYGNHSDVFDASFTTTQALAKAADVIDDTQGFAYRVNNDLMQFEDGSANPKGELIQASALVPDGQAGAGGSVLLTQRWVHNLPKFDALEDDEQSQVIGRDKETNEELSGDAMPNNSHVSRTDLSLEGVAAKVWRRSSPYGNSQQHGLQFLSFACDQRRHQIQLDSMYGLTDGVTDRILEFSNAVSNHYFFAPSVEALDALYSDDL